MSKSAKKKVTVSGEERSFRKQQFSDVSTIVNSNPLCTSCNQSVKMGIINGKAFKHPYLETLFCEKCHTFYGNGEFSVDEDGSDKYCRWCGQGGTIFQCSVCPSGFCKKCIKRNLSRGILGEVEGDEWKCFCCDVKPLYELRALCWAAVEHALAVEKKLGKKRARKSSESDNEPPEHRRLNARAKALSKQCRRAQSTYSQHLGELMDVSNKIRSKVAELKSTKVNRRAMDSVEVVEATSKEICDLLALVESECSLIKEKISGFVDPWKETTEEFLKTVAEEVEAQILASGQKVDNDTSSDKPKDEKTSESTSDEEPAAKKTKLRDNKEKDDKEQEDEKGDKNEEESKDKEDETSSVKSDSSNKVVKPRRMKLLNKGRLNKDKEKKRMRNSSSECEDDSAQESSEKKNGDTTIASEDENEETNTKEKEEHEETNGETNQDEPSNKSRTESDKKLKPRERLKLLNKSKKKDSVTDSD